MFGYFWYFIQDDFRMTKGGCGVPVSTKLMKSCTELHSSILTTEQF